MKSGEEKEKEQSDNRRGGRGCRSSLSHNLPMDQLSNLRVAYRILEDGTERALRTQIGDHQRLGYARDDALRLSLFINEVGGQGSEAFEYH